MGKDAKSMDRCLRIAKHLAPLPAAELPEYTIEEIKKHADKKGKECWIIIDGLVYDMNIDSPLKGGHSSGEPKFLTDHPGGKDASEVFKEFHSKSILEKYGPGLCIGKVKA